MVSRFPLEVSETRLVVLLRSAAGNVEVLAALAIACLYAALISGHPQGADGIIMFNQARSIAYDQSLHFRQPIGDATTSPYGIGLSLLYLPGFVIWSVVQPFVPVDIRYPKDWATPSNDPLFTLIGTPLHIMIAVLSAYLVARFCRELGLSRRASLWGMAFYAVGSPAIVYAREDYAQPLVGLLGIAGLYAAVRFRRTGRFRFLLACAALLGYAILTRPVEGALLFPPISLLVVPHLRPWQWAARTWRTVAVLVVFGAAAVAVTLLINDYRYGSGSSTGYEAREGWTTPLWIGLPGSLISPGRGIVFWFPAVFLVLLGLRRLWQKANDRTLAPVIAAILGLWLLNTATWYGWWGGPGWGLRLFMPALPLLAVLAASGVQSLPASTRPWLPVLLLVAGFVWAVPGILVMNIGGYYDEFGSAKTSDQFRWEALPLIGAWQYLDTWRATTLADKEAADILWLRLAHRTNNLSLLPPLLFIVMALALIWRIAGLLKDSASFPLTARSRLTAQSGGIRS